MFATKLVFIFSVRIKCVVQSTQHEKKSGSGSSLGDVAIASACNKINWFFSSSYPILCAYFPQFSTTTLYHSAFIVIFDFVLATRASKVSTIIWLAQREYACMSLGNFRWFDCCVCKLFGPNNGLKHVYMYRAHHRSIYSISCERFANSKAKSPFIVCVTSGWGSSTFLHC